MTLSSYLQILRRRWLLIGAMTLLGIIAAVSMTVLTPPSYSAQASAFVTITSTGSESNSLYQNSQFALQRVKSYPQVINSPDVLQTVIDQLQLDISLKDLQDSVTADNPPDTVLLNITAESKSPAQAEAIANAAADRLGIVIERLETSRGGTAPVKVTTAVPAGLPQSPDSPRPALNLALGLLLGLALGIGAAVLREQQDTTLKGDDLQDITGTAPLGIIGFDPDAGKQPLIAMQGHSAGVEAFRTMRTNLQFVDVGNPPRQIVITSAVAGEGKTTTACNLAVTLAESSLNVCLVEADLRRPKVSSYLGIDGTFGLTNVLAGQFPLDEMLLPLKWHRGLLTILPAGTTPPDPSHLLGSNNMAVLLQELSNRFDVVIIDAPPLLPVTDAAVLAQATDGALFVSRYGHTRRELVTKALEDLQIVNARLIGTVLTFVPAKGHHYGYGYGYTADERVRRPSFWRRLGRRGLRPATTTSQVARPKSLRDPDAPLRTEASASVREERRVAP